MEPENKTIITTEISNDGKWFYYWKKVQGRLSSFDYFFFTKEQEIEKLADHYVIPIIKKQTGIDVETIKEHPELIKNQKEQIKLKRLLKNKKGKHGK